MEIEQLRAAKSNLSDSVARTMDELEAAQFPAVKAEGHADQLKVRVSLKEYLV